jgi:hypothetical protein
LFVTDQIEALYEFVTSRPAAFVMTFLPDCMRRLSHGHGSCRAARWCGSSPR